MEKPIWYHLFYSSPETLKNVLDNRKIEPPKPKNKSEFAYSEDLGLAYNEFLINNFPPLPLVKSLGYIEPDVFQEEPDQEYDEFMLYLEQKYLEEEEEAEEYDDLEDRFPLELETESEQSSSSDEYEDEWTTV